MFGQKNQHFTTLDLVIMVVLCGLVSSVAGALLAQGLHDNRSSRAHAGAEALALQLKEQHIAAIQSRPQSGERSPASVGDEQPVLPILSEGRIGRDPWGHPYHYSVRQDLSQNRRAVLVWSDGPDGISATEVEKLSEDELAAGQPFRGDDVGHVQFLTAVP